MRRSMGMLHFYLCRSVLFFYKCTTAGYFTSTYIYCVWCIRVLEGTSRACVCTSMMLAVCVLLFPSITVIQRKRTCCLDAARAQSVSKDACGKSQNFKVVVIVAEYTHAHIHTRAHYISFGFILLFVWDGR